LIAGHARDLLRSEHPELAERVAAYRAGFLTDERRALERGLASGDILGMATTSALELGIDIGGLDACVLAGYPGTIAATWQQAGRAGRSSERSLAVLVAQDDPLDQYVVAHPDHLFGKPVEAAVIDHANPNVLDDHLAAAAYEHPLTEDDEAVFGPSFVAAVERLEGAGRLKRKRAGWFFNGRGSPSSEIDIRSAGRVVSIVELDTGRLLGTSDGSRALHTLHPGAVYLHQGEQFEVRTLDLDAHVALVRPVDVLHYTQARDVTDIRIAAVEESARAGAVDLFFGDVVVSNQVVSFARKRLYTNETIDESALDLPEQVLQTKAVWYTVPADILARARLADADVPGAVHAAEHCAIGIMPLFAMCDRWDIGGVSTALHPDTGECTVFVYDGYPGGAGFARRSFDAGEAHLRATLDTIERCPCEHGCPSCVQSPKCGNGNEPLDKHAAVRLLRAILNETGRPAPLSQPSARASR
jgi:DEAD/DEAH box helicase domain-containing protein